MIFVLFHPCVPLSLSNGLSKAMSSVGNQVTQTLVWAQQLPKGLGEVTKHFLQQIYSLDGEKSNKQVHFFR